MAGLGGPALARLRGRSEVRTGACMRVAPSREVYFEIYL
jgi:hypothetical protein